MHHNITIVLEFKKHSKRFNIFFGCFVVGYMCSPAVLDKDGVSAAAIAGEFVSYLASKNITLSHQLRSIYEEYVAKTLALLYLKMYVLNLLIAVFTLFFQVWLPHFQEFLLYLSQPRHH